ncbi:hypothetical protein [Virgisporangium aurantiacum]|uniref:hypothetical protein n=1 Tax=Virgisporangium aurantiacum TaxID=175570 RepID=UPI001951E910|nr:hypothetical protein [Virgisporangium aurantiacum]
MQQSRFVFVAVPTAYPNDADAVTGSGRPAGAGLDRILWILVSPNNRPLGRSAVRHDSYPGCHAAVLRVRADIDRGAPVVAVEETGQWNWQVQLDGEPVAVSSRSYLRVRECNYNLARFLDTVPQAAIVEGARRVRRDRRGDTGRSVSEPLPSDGAGGHRLVSGRW